MTDFLRVRHFASLLLVKGYYLTDFNEFIRDCHLSDNCGLSRQ